MTSVNHTVGGFTIGAVLAYLVGWFWPLTVTSAAIGAFPDVADWILWKFFGWPRWKFYNMCHPFPGMGQWDRYGRWLPMWGCHTWVIDSVVHPMQPRFIFPKFPVEWDNIEWIIGHPAWGIRLTKWDAMYCLLELAITAIYVAILITVL